AGRRRTPSSPGTSTTSAWPRTSRWDASASPRKRLVSLCSWFPSSPPTSPAAPSTWTGACRRRCEPAQSPAWHTANWAGIGSATMGAVNGAPSTRAHRQRHPRLQETEAREHLVQLRPGAGIYGHGRQAYGGMRDGAAPVKEFLANGEADARLAFVRDDRQVAVEYRPGSFPVPCPEPPVNLHQYLGKGETGHGAHGAPAELVVELHAAKPAEDAHGALYLGQDLPQLAGGGSLFQLDVAAAVDLLHDPHQEVHRHDDPGVHRLVLHDHRQAAFAREAAIVLKDGRRVLQPVGRRGHHRRRAGFGRLLRPPDR